MKNTEQSLLKNLFEIYPSKYEKIFTSNFLTQLPALNRYEMMKKSFLKLLNKDFSEFDFQKFCYEQYQINAILDGGIFNADMTSWGKNTITGSWTDENLLKQIGYCNTRFSNIKNNINVSKLV